MIEPNTSRRRRGGALSWALLVVVAVFVGIALVRNWQAVRADLALIGMRELALSCAFAAAAAVCSALAWRVVLVGLGQQLALHPTLTVFFTGQMGKYVPGSVWTAAIQAQLAARWGLRRAEVVLSYLVVLAISIAAGALVGLLVLLGQASAALRPVLGVGIAVGILVSVALLRPRLLNRMLAGLAARTGTDMGTLDLPPRTLAAAAAMTTATWGLLGFHVWILAAPLGASVGDLPATIGAFTLAFVGGILVVPLPAGAGVREGVLVATLAPVIGAESALTVSLVSRLLLLLVDLCLVGMSGGLTILRTSLRQPHPDVASGPDL